MLVSVLSAELSATRPLQFAVDPSDYGSVKDMHATESPAAGRRPAFPSPVVIGHRGAPAYRPEHTAASYDLAIDLGAELIEPDVVVSRDGALVVRHESELSLSTDVAGAPEFADRRTTQEVDGGSAPAGSPRTSPSPSCAPCAPSSGCRSCGPLNTAYDGHFGILTLAEVVELARTPVHPRPADPRARRAQAPRLVDRARAADGRAGRRRAAPARRRRRRRSRCASSPSSAGVLRELRARLGSDGPQMVQLVDDDPEGDRMVTPRRAAGDLHLRPGDRARAGTASCCRADGRSSPASRR